VQYKTNHTIMFSFVSDQQKSLEHETRHLTLGTSHTLCLKVIVSPVVKHLCVFVFINSCCNAQTRFLFSLCVNCQVQ